MIKNIDDIVREIGNERDACPKDPEYKMMINEYSETLAMIEKCKESPEEGKNFMLEVDSVVGAYIAMTSTRYYTQGFRDCLRGIFALLTAVE